MIRAAVDRHKRRLLQWGEPLAGLVEQGVGSLGGAVVIGPHRGGE
jgi:hypothetical protein